MFGGGGRTGDGGIASPGRAQFTHLAEASFASAEASFTLADGTFSDTATPAQPDSYASEMLGAYLLDVAGTRSYLGRA